MVLAVIASTFFVGFGGGVVFPILPNLGDILGISPFLVGVILSANRISRIFANGPAGSLVDRIGTRTPFVAGLVVEAIAVFGFVIALQAPAPAAWFIVSRLLWGVGSAAVFATAYTIAADVSDGGSRGTNMGIVRGGITLGFPAGLVLGGVVSDTYSIVAAFVAAAGFAILASVVGYLLVPETHVSTRRTAVKPWEIDTALPTLTVGFVNFGMFFAYLGALFSTLVLFVDTRGLFVWGYGAQGTSGVFMAATVVAASMFMLAAGKYSDVEGHRVPVLILFVTVSAVGYLLLARAGSLAALLTACVCIGAGFGGTSGPLMALLADLTATDRMGRAIGTNNILGDLGGALGPMVTLPLIDIVGFVPVYIACAALPVIAGGVMIGGVYTETGAMNPSTDAGVNEGIQDP
ncbi:MAG: MFS transporter [Halobacteriales archaeon]